MQTPKRFLRLKEVEAKVGLKRDRIYAGGREGWFPKSVRINTRAVGWVESEVDAFIDARIAASRSAPEDPAAKAGAQARDAKAARKARNRQAAQADAA